MWRLTRAVRFAVNAVPDEQLRGRPTNGFGGFPSLTGLGYFFVVEATVRGDVDPLTSYLLNIREIDQAVRTYVVPLVTRRIREGRFGGGGTVAREIFDELADRIASSGVSLDAIDFRLTPFLFLSVRSTEHPMVRISQKFEFSASHRLHNPELSDAENRSRFGKCNNPHGHGHNYELQVTLLGTPDANGSITSVPDFERVVNETVVQRFDHKNLNVELPEFRELIPSVENIAKVIYRLLKPRFAEPATLAAVTVWETPKTWCEYTE
jgi:6-pyruvoyltetrahydropterin/6-carboxytetrahydropterin synthase